MIRRKLPTAINLIAAATLLAGATGPALAGDDAPERDPVIEQLLAVPSDNADRWQRYLDWFRDYL